jgi:8-hydroxy-5-deazaflavin:NADPH oxidoreductase
MRIGIIGAGAIGGTLAHLLVRVGHEVSIANSRGPETLADLAKKSGARAVTLAEAARAKDVVIVSIPQEAIQKLPENLFAGTPKGTVIIDTGNYFPGVRDERIAALEAGQLDSAWVSERLGRPVVKVFNTIDAEILLDGGKPAGAPGRIALPVSGADVAARAAVISLLNEIGFDSVDVGDVGESWRHQPGTPAYANGLGVEALKKALAAADRSRMPVYRVEADAHARKRVASLAAAKKNQTT